MPITLSNFPAFNYEIIYSRFNKRIKELKEFLDILNKKLSIESQYSKLIRDISQSTMTTLKESSTAEIFESFKSSSKNYYNYSNREFINPLKSDVIDPLVEFMRSIKAEGLKYNDIYRKTEKRYKDALDKLEKSKNKYHQLSKNKIQKLSNNLNDDKIKMITNSTLEEMKIAEENYMKILSLANDAQEQYIENTKIIFSEFEFLEEKYIVLIKEIFKKINIYQLSVISVQKLECELIGKAIESINVKDEIRKISEFRKEDIKFPEKITFIQYIPEDIKIHRSTPNLIKIFRQSSLVNSKLATINEKTNKRIADFVMSVWNGDQITDFEKSEWEEYMKEMKYRKQFFTLMNQFRIKGTFELNDSAYINFGNLFLLIIDEIVINKDYENFRSLMILSQTFYKKDLGRRLFLQKLIEIHSVWENIEFWERVIEYSIDEELKKQQNLITNNEDIEDIHCTKQNLIFGQLITFCFDLLALKFNRSLIESILLRFAKQFGLTESLKNELIYHLDSNGPENKKEIQIDELELIYTEFEDTKKSIEENIQN